MKQLAIGLLVTQVIAAIAMLVAAAIEIETICFTGPTLTVVGLLLALVVRRLQSWPTLLFALSGPLICAVISLLIAVFRWPPGEAEDPAVAILSAYVLALLPGAIVPLRRLLNWDELSAAVSPQPWQFSLKSLLVLMTSICLLLFVGKLLFRLSPQEEMLIFGSYALLVSALCGHSIWRFAVYRAPTETDDAAVGGAKN